MSKALDQEVVVAPSIYIKEPNPLGSPLSRTLLTKMDPVMRQKPDHLITVLQIVHLIF